MGVSLDQFNKAVSALELALQAPKSDLNRDATIQRFEFCVELAWKTAKKALGLSATAPKIVLREMAQQGVISDPQVWFDYLQARNLSSHTYQEELAEQVYQTAQKSLQDFKDLAEKLRSL